MTLSPTELKIVQMLADGLNSNEIAAKRCRGIKTIWAQVRAAKRRNGAHTTAQLVAMCLRKGVIR